MSNKNNHRTLNFQLALKASANNEQLAITLLAVFMQQIDEYNDKLNKYINEADNELLQQLVHKLHGALQYIGAPQLTTIVQQLDGKVKQLNPQILSAQISLISEQFELIKHEKYYLIDE